MGGARIGQANACCTTTPTEASCITRPWEHDVVADDRVLLPLLCARRLASRPARLTRIGGWVELGHVRDADRPTQRFARHDTGRSPYPSLQADALAAERDDRVECRSPMLETVIGRAFRRRERLAAPDAPISTTLPRSRSVETVVDDVPGTDSSMDRTHGIGTSTILHFGLALVGRNCVSWNRASNSSTQTGYQLVTNT